MPIIDTLAAVEGLTKAKMPKEQARKIVEILGAAHDELVTKNDLNTLRNDFDSTIAKLEVTLTWRMLAVAGLLFAALRFTG